jgi:hypothetical protein
MIRRALCIALADSMSPVRADSLTHAPDQWKELLDFIMNFEREQKQGVK